MFFHWRCSQVDKTSSFLGISHFFWKWLGLGWANPGRNTHFPVILMPGWARCSLCDSSLRGSSAEPPTWLPHTISVLFWGSFQCLVSPSTCIFTTIWSPIQLISLVGLRIQDVEGTAAIRWLGRPLWIEKWGLEFKLGYFRGLSVGMVKWCAQEAAAHSPVLPTPQVGAIDTSNRSTGGARRWCSLVLQRSTSDSKKHLSLCLTFMRFKHMEVTWRASIYA